MRERFRLLAAVALGFPAISLAGPSDYVYVPSVEYGEREIDLKYGTEKARSPRAAGAKAPEAWASATGRPNGGSPRRT
jgi:hypothetical protein